MDGDYIVSPLSAVSEAGEEVQRRTTLDAWKTGVVPSLSPDIMGGSVEAGNGETRKSMSANGGHGSIITAENGSRFWGPGYVNKGVAEVCGEKSISGLGSCFPNEHGEVVESKEGITAGTGSPESVEEMRRQENIHNAGNQAFQPWEKTMKQLALASGRTSGRVNKS